MKLNSAQESEAGKSRTRTQKVNAGSLSSGVRFTSIDKPIVDLPKRQSAIVKESRHIVGVGEAITHGTTLMDEEDALSDGTRPGASDAKSNGGKTSSRGSLKRRIFGNGGGNGYFTSAQARGKSKDRTGNGTSIAPKDAYEAENLLSDAKQIEQYFSNHKLDDQSPTKKKEAQQATFQGRDSASVTYGAAKTNFKSNRSAISKSGMNHSQENQGAANSQQRFSQRTELGSYSHHRSSLQNGRVLRDPSKAKDNSEAAKSSGSQSGLVKCQFDASEATKASSNMQNSEIGRLVQKGLKRRETHD